MLQSPKTTLKKLEQQTASSHSVHWWFSHQRPVRKGLHCQARCDHDPHHWPQPLVWQWKCKQSHMPSSGLPQVRPHMSSSSQVKWTFYKYFLWLHCPGHARLKQINDQTDSQAGEATVTSALIAFRKTIYVEEFETLPVISHHRPPGRERRRKRKR